MSERNFNASELQEENLEPNEARRIEQIEQDAAEHSPTGTAKTGTAKRSLLARLADEALAEGRPVFLIPPEPADPRTHSADDQQPPHDLRLPKNTTVIFTGEEGFPAKASATAAQVTTDPGEARNCFSVSTSSATPVRVVDPEDPDSQRWRPLEAGGKLLTPHIVILASAGEGKVHSQGQRKAEKKRISFDDADHLNTSNAREESQ